MPAKKKVMLIGPENFGYNQSIASAFDTEIFQVQVIDYAEQFGRICMANKCRYFVASNRTETTKTLLNELNNYLIKAFNRFKPDLVVVIKGDTIDAKTLQAMSRAKRILWMMDSIFYNPQSINLVNHVEAIFLFEKSDVDKVLPLNPNSHYLPSAVDEKIYHRLHLPKDIDLLFIGTLYPERIELLRKIRKTFPQLKIKVFCERYRFYKHPVKFIKSLFDSTYINRFVTPKEANRLYNRAKICLNMHHRQSIYGINPRFFEILGSGATLITDYRPFMADYFEGAKIGIYHSEAELISAIEKALSMSNFDENLYNEIRSQHTYRNRVEFILQSIA